MTQAPAQTSSVELKAPTKEDPTRTTAQAVSLLSGKPVEVSKEALASLPPENSIEYSKPQLIIARKGSNPSSWIGDKETKSVSAEFFIPTDGDTAIVKNPKDPKHAFICRFSGSDAPEISHGKEPDQPYGRESLENLKKLVANKEVTVSVQEGWDKHGGRRTCKITVAGKDIELEQIKGGYAWLYDQFATPDVKETYRAAQKQAMTQELGLWSKPGAVNPGDWRHKVIPLYNK